MDEKRPITIDILRRLSLKAVARELGVLENYLQWAEAVQVASNGQLELGLAEQPSPYKAQVYIQHCLGADGMEIIGEGSSPF